MHFLLYSSFLRDVKEKGFLFLVLRSSFFVKTKNQELLNNPSQAVPLDKDLALPEHVKRVDVVAMGRCRIITPAGEAWDSWFDGPGMTQDFIKRALRVSDN